MRRGFEVLSLDTPIIGDVRGMRRNLAGCFVALVIALWDLEPTHWLDAACQVAGRNLTPEEWDQYLGEFGPYHETCVAGKANE